jgi:hypothetical protein
MFSHFSLLRLIHHPVLSLPMLKELARAAAVHRGARVASGHRHTGRTSAPHRCRPSQVSASLLHLARRLRSSPPRLTSPTARHQSHPSTASHRAVAAALGAVTALGACRARCVTWAGQATVGCGLGQPNRPTWPIWSGRHHGTQGCGCCGFGLDEAPHCLPFSNFVNLLSFP